MPRRRSTDGSIADLGILITSAHGLDRAWQAEARCVGVRHEKIPEATGPTPWQFDPNQQWRVYSEDGKKVVAIIRGEEAIKLALLICRGCPVQWECASHAVRARMFAGTWAMYISDLMWLQKPRIDAQEIIDNARFDGVPVQVRVGELRRADEARRAAKRSA